MRLVPALVLPALALGAFAMPAWAQQQNPNPSFTLANKGSQTINEVYATPSGVDRWGQDRLANNNIPAGGTFPLRLPADGNCVYDVRVVYADGKPEEKRRLNTCRIQTLSFPGGQTVAASGSGGSSQQAQNSFRLVNHGSQEVNEIYVSPSGDDDWGSDRLGNDTLAAGKSQTIQLTEGKCTYDIRVVFENGDALERRKRNLCGVGEFAIP